MAYRNIVTMPPKIIQQIENFGKSYNDLTKDTVKGFYRIALNQNLKSISKSLMKIKVYENKWHDIPFDKLKVNLTSSKKASLEFYNNFYERFSYYITGITSFLKNG